MSDVSLFIEAKHRLGESIIWHESQGCLFWIDLLDPALFRHDLQSGETQSWPVPLVAPLGAIAATTDPDKLVLSYRDGIMLLSLSSMALEDWCNPEQGRDGVMYNDAKVDRMGRLWAGSSHVAEQEPRGALWCIETPQHFSLGDAGFAIANGPAISPDGRTLYLNDSARYMTYAYDVEAGHLQPQNRRALITFPVEDGMPDGIITDTEGCLWIAHWGGGAISRHSPDGRQLARWIVPAPNVTTMCFAGPDYSTLYITTARDGMDDAALRAFPLSGSMFRLETNVKGMAEPLLQLR
jgi:sugar lactone lactonase YvrE